MGNASFQEILLRAWKVSYGYPVLWAFGLFVAVAATAENMLPARAIDLSSFDKFLASVTDEPRTVLFLFFLSVALFAVSVFGKSNLIVALSLLSDKKKTDKTFHCRSVRGNFFRAFRLELTVIGFLITVLIILSFPSLLAYWYNTDVLPLIFSWSLLTLVPIVFIAFIVREFALFYFLLSPLRLFSAFENAGAILSRHFIRCVIFCLSFLGLLLIFTFCLNLAMLSISALFPSSNQMFLGKTMLAFFVNLISLTWWNVLQQAFWLFFFKDLALPKQLEKTSTEEEAPAQEKIPELPPA